MLFHSIYSFVFTRSQISQIAIILCFIVPLASCASTGQKFEQAKQRDTVYGYQEFLRQYPDSEFSNQARSRKEELLEEERRMVESIRSLKRGVSRMDVRNLIGEPHKSSSLFSVSGIVGDAEKQDIITDIKVWVYKFGDKKYTLHFEKGGLTKVLVGSTTIPLAD